MFLNDFYNSFFKKGFYELYTGSTNIREIEKSDVRYKSCKKRNLLVSKVSRYVDFLLDGE